MTDEQIKELFDTVPAFADSCIESLRPAPFLRSISRCLSASVNTGLIYVTVNPNYPGMTWWELLDKGEKMRKNIRLFTVNPEYYLNLERFRAPFMSFCFHDGKGYVAEDGCHRACIAKFFLYSQPSPFLRGVHFTEVQTDARMTTSFTGSKNFFPRGARRSPTHRKSPAMTTPKNGACLSMGTPCALKITTGRASTPTFRPKNWKKACSRPC